MAADDFTLPAGFELIAADPELGPRILTSLARIEERLGEAITQTDKLADVASRHLLLAGGKRVRPLLTLLAAAVDGQINDEVTEAAVVVELTHLATLYHDDVMDEAPKRRGVDTAQTIWGNSVAILTGDLIFSRASLLVSELGTRPMKIQAQTFERLVLGQLYETTGPREHQDILDHYIAVIEGKTGSLIAAAGEYGSLLSGASEETVQIMARYGELVGVAFQLADDVIDIVSDGASSGKHAAPTCAKACRPCPPSCSTGPPQPGTNPPVKCVPSLIPTSVLMRHWGPPCPRSPHTRSQSRHGGSPTNGLTARLRRSRPCLKAPRKLPSPHSPTPWYTVKGNYRVKLTTLKRGMQAQAH